MNALARIAALLLSAGAVLQAGAPGALAAERPTIWDISLGQHVSDLPGPFVEYACGTGGGPPGRPLRGFSEFAECRADASGLREVYFRYNDEDEYVARALEQAWAIESTAGTRVFGVLSLVSVLLDEEGVVRGLRVASDPRGIGVGERSDAWSLAGRFMDRYGAEGWVCETNEPRAGQTPVATYPVDDVCRKSTAEAELTVTRQYLHRRGQVFLDEFGKVQPTHFISGASFEILAADLPAAPRAD